MNPSIQRLVTLSDSFSTAGRKRIEARIADPVGYVTNIADGKRTDAHILDQNRVAAAIAGGFGSLFEGALGLVDKITHRGPKTPGGGPT